jgi:hypothetical protein
MKFVAGKLNNTTLIDIVLKHINECSEVVAVVPYCSSDRLFELCLKAGKRVTYYGRLDATVPVTSSVLKWFIRQRSLNYSCYLLHGGLHAKIIWMKGEGAYIGSANLTDKGWFENIEAGLYVTEEDLSNRGLIDQLQYLIDSVHERSTPLSEEIVALVKVLEEKRYQIKVKEKDVGDWFRNNCNVPEVHSLFSGKPIGYGDVSKTKFLKEWNGTLQLLRNIALRLREHRPAWIDQNVPDGVHVDQFLHAYYYLRIREGNRQPFDEHFERNRRNPEEVLLDQMKWWKQGDYPHDSEYNFIHNWAPSSRQLLSKDKIETLSEDEFVRLCLQVHAIRDHAIKQESEMLGLEEGAYPADVKRKAFGRWLYKRTSNYQVSVLETIAYVLYGGDQIGLPDRLWDATKKEKWKIEHLGLSSLGELAGWAMPDIFPPRNSRTSKALRALGNSVEIY